MHLEIRAARRRGLSVREAAVFGRNHANCREIPCFAPRRRLAAPLLMAVTAALALAGCNGGKVASAPPAVVVALPVHPDAGSAGGLAIRYP